MITEHSVHWTIRPVGFCTRVWQYTCLLLLILMLWDRKAIFESKWGQVACLLNGRIVAVTHAFPWVFHASLRHPQRFTQLTEFILLCFRREPLEPGIKLVITLRYQVMGVSYHSIAFTFHIPYNTISLFVPDVCKAIINEYWHEVFELISNPETWGPIAEHLSEWWNFCHACCAIDGKHIAIKKPRKSGTLFYNYKDFFSFCCSL